LAPPRATKPCALRVSHPLDALLPNEPSELISSRSRSQGFTLQGLIPEPTLNVLSNAHPPMAFLARALTLTPYLRGLPVGPVSPTTLGYSPAAIAIPFLGFLSFEASCPARRPSVLSAGFPTLARRMRRPLLRFLSVSFPATRTGLTTEPALQGFYRAARNASLSRNAGPPWSLSPHQSPLPKYE
jgi:hypothetical protein